MSESTKNIRIGPLSLFALIAMLFLSTLAVLSITTAEASLNLSTLQSDSMKQQYQAENAAQRFVALLDSRYSNGSIITGPALPTTTSDNSANAEQLIDSALSDGQSGDNAPTSPVDALAKEAAESVSTNIVGTASISGSTVTAQFTCLNGRILDIELTLGANNAISVDKWNMTAIVNNAEAETLWSGM